MTAPTVKAVGFAYTSPEVIILFAQHKEHRLAIFPPKDGSTLTLSDDGRPNVILLRTIDKLHAVAPLVADIHRLIVFGGAKDLLELGLPILDAAVNPEDGKTSPQRRQAAEDVLRRIEDEAVDLTVLSAPTLSDTNQPVQEKKKMPSGKTFVGLMRTLRDKVGKDNPDLNFVEDVGVPAVNRLFGDIDQLVFRDACKLLVTHGGLGENAARYFYRWIEGHSGEGPQLSKAAEAYMYPADGEDAPDLNDLAAEFEVDAGDIQFVCATYEKLHAEEEPEEEEAEEDDGWDSEGGDDFEEESSEEEEPSEEEESDEAEEETTDDFEEESSEEETDSSGSDFDGGDDFGDGIFDSEETSDAEEPEPFDADDSEKAAPEETDSIADGFSDAPDFGEFGEESGEDSDDSGNEKEDGFDGGFDDF